ncbi:MAG TPA: glycosyltransferase [Anaerolineae bacterium]|nr:glycosyltransferase [Anaerolineae bacterium]
MRILHIYKDYFPVLGGIENHVRVLAEAGVQRGHEVTVLAASLDRSLQIETLNGVKLIKTPRWINISSAPMSPAMFRWAQKIGASAGIVHLHFPYPLGELAHLFSGSPAKTIITYHSDIVRQKFLRMIYRPFLWRILRKADRIIATSDRYRDTSPYISRFKEKCVTIPLGSDIDHFANVDPQKVLELRKQLIPDKERTTHSILLSVGRLRYYKGLDDLIRALPAIPDAITVIVGSGPMQAEWRQLVRSGGVANRVVFAGEVDDQELPLYYAASDLFVLPANARAEAFGTVIVEAMAAGRAVISTEIGTGTSWINVNGQTGLVVPPHAPDQLAAAINSLLNDPDRRKKYGQAAQVRAQADFSVNKMIDRVYDVYQSLIEH